MGGNRIDHLGRSSAGDGAARIDDIADHVTLPRPAGVANPGGNPMGSPSDHVHPDSPATTSPAVVESTLYPAFVPDPNLRREVRALSAIGAGYGLAIFNDYGTGDFTAVSGLYTWQRNTPDPVNAYVPSGAYPQVNFPLSAGDRFAVLNSSSTGGAKKCNGIYELITQGDGISICAVIRRTTDANTTATMGNGTVVRISADGGDAHAFAGQYIEFTTATPTLDVTEISYTIPYSYSPTPTNELLTGPQLSSLGASSDTIDTSKTLTNATGNFDTLFETTVGVPALDALPVGIWTFAAEAVRLDPAYPPSAGSVTTLQWQIAKDTGSITVLFIAESTPITSFDPVPLSFQYNDTVGGALSPTDRLRAVPFLHTTSTTPVRLWLRYNSAARGTRITVPFALPIAGASDGVHGHLSGLSDPGQHPRYAITDAIGTATVSGSGTSTRLALAAPFRSGEMTLTDTILVLYGIDPTGWSDGQVLELFVDSLHPGSPSSNLTLVHIAGNSDGSDIYVGVNLATGAGQDATYTRPVALKLKRRARLNRWQLMEARM
jgi:hypothetical protein